MKNKTLIMFTALFMAFAFSAPSSFALGGREAAASLFLPTTGQAMNGQLGNTKTKLMAGVEVAAITTVAVLGTAVGGGIVWLGLGPLLANHAWSSVDAYRGAQNRSDLTFQEQMQMAQAQQTLDLSRQRRYDRQEQLDIRQRVARAGEAY